MKVIQFDNGGGQMVRVNMQEALMLITTLSEQIRLNSPNGARTEFTTVDGKYFSIAVHLENRT